MVKWNNSKWAYTQFFQHQFYPWGLAVSSCSNLFFSTLQVITSPQSLIENHSHRTSQLVSISACSCWYTKVLIIWISINRIKSAMTILELSSWTVWLDTVCSNCTLVSFPLLTTCSLTWCLAIVYSW